MAAPVVVIHSAFVGIVFWNNHRPN